MTGHEEIHIQIEPGGSLNLSCPRTEAERSTCFNMAFGLSVALGAAVVKVVHWLPGLHLYVQVAPAMVTTQTVPVARVWPALDRAMQRWLAEPNDGGVLHHEAAWGRCVLAPEVYIWSRESVGFTLTCRWPGARAWLRDHAR